MPLKDKKKRKEYDKRYYEENCETRKEYRKKYHKNNLEKEKKYDKKYYIEHRERKLKRDKQRREEVKKYVNNYKLSKGCETCGYNRCVEALIFHHINNGDKEFDVSSVVKYGGNIERIKSEINKCMVLCSNCHAELHTKLRKKEVI